MANLFPHISSQMGYGFGAEREREILQLLQKGLPPQYDLFHNLHWSAMLGGQQHIGEVDIVVLSPEGHILLLEVKAGAVIEKPWQLFKDYGGQLKDIGAQVRRQHASFLDRMQKGRLPKVQIDSLLVLPDHHLNTDLLAYPPERVVDAGQIDSLCQCIQSCAGATELSAAERQQWQDFLSNRFQVTPDVATHIGQVQQINTRLSGGMAQWVPQIQHAQGTYVVQATAGSGKTQLALGLLQQAAQQKQRARYVCFNRPLADHLARVAPPQCDVTTFHQLCRDHASRQNMVLDFADSTVFDRMAARYVHDAEQQSPALDLLILDESQDLDPAWAQALMPSLKPEGRLYVLGDADQQLYPRDSFELPDAVHIRCMDNFRSPRKVVEAINDLALTEEPVHARSIYEGEVPGFHLYGPGHGRHDEVLTRCLRQLWQDGYTPEQVAVLSYRGMRTAQTPRLNELAQVPTRRFAGQYDSAGNPCWTDGRLLVDSVYRFKGQSMPVVVLCEVDFETLSEQDRRKLFVGLTRAQLRVKVVLSTQACNVLGVEC